MKVEVYTRFSLKSFKRLWYWRVRAGNGEIVASGEGYVNRADALAMIARLKAELPEARVINMGGDRG